MNGSLLLMRKDLFIFFRSPLAYIVMACFLLISGYFFATAVQYFEMISIQVMQNPNIKDFTPNEMIIVPFIQNSGVILLFFLPLLTMRGFSEEKRMGTFEMLLSYPLREHQIVGGKLLALAVFLLAMLALSAVSPGLLFLFSEPELLPALMGYLGLFLLSVSFAALGLFLSSLTENQIVAAVLTFAALLLLWLLSWAQQVGQGPVVEILGQLSPMSHFEPFTNGVLDVAHCIYYITFTAGFFWLSVLSLENQRWRG